MPRPLSGLLAGVLAGAAGATALNAVTYLDQAVRARPAGSTPEDTVEALADKTGATIPGSAEEKGNRLQGLGPLSGLAVGVGVGAVAGVLRAFSLKVPKPLSAVAVGVGAMAISDSTMTALGITNPKKWDANTLVSDLVPHLVYGMVTTATLHRILDPLTPVAR